jgi:hypothetical protein
MVPCPNCGEAVFGEDVACRSCGIPVAYHAATNAAVEVSAEKVEIQGRMWRPCSRRDWGCNWLAIEDAEAGRCFSCRLIRHRPDSDDTIALEKLATATLAERRLLIQLNRLGLPIDPFYEKDGGLGFDLLSSFSRNEPVMIGHANGIVTIDLAESVDAHRERLRSILGEAYRTMLGHFRHEVGHYYQWILIEQPEPSPWIDECRELFGDERASYSDAIDRHYRFGAPEGWRDSYISEYATMHPWEDFAECFAHYLHITDTLAVSAAAGMELMPGRNTYPPPRWTVQPLPQYGRDDMSALLEDWHWVSLFFNRVNRSMGKDDLYPFEITPQVAAKLEFVHRVSSSLPDLQVNPEDGFRRSAA